MAFELFTGKGKNFRPRASVWKGGQIGLNQGAVEKFGLSGNAFVLMYYDKETRRIGLKFTDNGEEEGAIKMNVTNNASVISAKSFLDCYDVNHDETRRYDIFKDEQTDYYIIDLKKPK